jgi:hypothetical protein
VHGSYPAGAQIARKSGTNIVQLRFHPLKNAAATSGFVMLSMKSVMRVSYTVAVRGEEGTGYLAN